MTPPRRNIQSGWQSKSSSKLPVSRPLSQPSRSPPDRFEKAASEESNSRSRSGFQHWRNLPTTHHVDTNDTMESEENNEIKTLKQGMDAVATALVRGNLRNFTESELRKVEGLKKVPAKEIYSKLAANISAARTFLGLPPEDRAIWLCVEFGSDIFDDPNVPF